MPKPAPAAPRRRRSPEDDWIRFSVRVPLAATDTLGARCIELGAPGVIVDERNLRRDATTDGGVRRPSPTARFSAYFPADRDPLRLEAELREALEGIAREVPGIRVHRRGLRLERFRPPSYATSWRRHFPPVRVGKRLLVAPTWTPVKQLRDAAAGRIVLRVDPAQAFGTGHHPTTRGCLVALQRVCARTPVPQSGLDVGSGTGVLAVAMRALGVREVVAVDNDPVARESTLDCARTNGFPDVRVDASLGRTRGRYDVVTANLFAGLLIEMAPALAARVRAGGHLIVAGLLASQERDVRDALESAGFVLERRECRATWSTLTLSRSATSSAAKHASKATGREHALAAKRAVRGTGTAVRRTASAASGTTRATTAASARSRAPRAASPATKNSAASQRVWPPKSSSGVKHPRRPRRGGSGR